MNNINSVSIREKMVMMISADAYISQSRVSEAFGYRKMIVITDCCDNNNQKSF